MRDQGMWVTNLCNGLAFLFSGPLNCELCISKKKTKGLYLVGCISRDNTAPMTILCGMYARCVYGSSKGQNTAISYARTLFDRDEVNALVTTFPFFLQTSLQITANYHRSCIQSST